MKPRLLKTGDTIGIICPSYSISKDSPRIELMEKYLKSLGFNVKYGKSFYSSYGYLAGEDQLRSRDLENMFLDDEVNAIVCMLGGYGASRMVDLIDYEKIKNHPKLFMGFSDVTVLLNALYQKAQIPTVHGVVGIYLGNPSMDKASFDDFESLVFNYQKGRVLKNPKDDCKTMVKGVVEGEIVGGNLSLIATLIGTDYEIDFKDKIVFIEEVEEEPYRIDRYFSSLRLAKKLEEAKGFVFGYFTDCNPSPSKRDTWGYLDILKQYIEKMNKPTIYDFASGHSFPFINVPIGIKAQLDANQKIITILEELYETD